MPTVDDIRWGPKDENLQPNGTIRRTCSAADAARIEKVILALFGRKGSDRDDQVVAAPEKSSTSESSFWLRIKDHQNRI